MRKYLKQAENEEREQFTFSKQRMKNAMFVEVVVGEEMVILMVKKTKRDE